ncbi:MAG: hypothetical protein WCP67_00095 [Verrucomicrobiota bacterium]
MLFVFAALSLAAATPDLPPAPPRVTMMTIPGRDVFALTYDVKHIDLPTSRQAEIAEALQSARLDQLLAAHLKLRTATDVAKKAGTAQDEAAKAVDREKDQVQRQQTDVDKAEKQVALAKQNLEAAQRRREDAKTIDGYQATLTSMNNRVSNEQKQVNRAREILTRAEGRVKEAAQVEAQAEKAQKVVADEYAKAATTAEPGLRKLRAAAGLPEPK